MKIWTIDEIEFLRANYPNFGIEYCCNFLQRSSASVRGKAFNLGLNAPGSKLKTHEEYETQLLLAEAVAYPLEQYITHKTPILHSCVEGHVWKAQPHNIINGHGCPICNRIGFNPSKPALVYYIKISKENLTYFKIGITNKTLEYRFRQDKDKEILVLKQWKFNLGSEARDLEKSILSGNKQHRVKIEGFLNGGGNSELFEFDVLGLDDGNFYSLF